MSPATIIRIESDPDYSCFAVLESSEDFVDGHLVLPTEFDTLYFYCIDPLTSVVQSCISGIDRHRIHTIRQINRLPVEEDYIIDSMATFYDMRLSRTYFQPDSDAEMIAVRFYSGFHSFLTRYPQLCSPRSSPLSPVLRSDLTALGIDFMRQRYRALKHHALRYDDGHLNPTLLYDLLKYTEEHRTTDEDWRNDAELFDWQA